MPARQDEVMVVRTLAFMIVRQVLSLIGAGPSPDAKDIEIAVLRHQLLVLRRQVPRPRYTPADRMILATLAKLLPRDRWPIFLVTPSTLLRWHRELIRRRWTYPTNGRRRRALDPEVIDFVLRLARERPLGASVSGAGVFGEQAAACRDRLAAFRQAMYRSLTRWPDALFELCDAILCTPGPVISLPELSLAGVHRRGHGSTYAALADGRECGPATDGAGRPAPAARQ
jgi:hypothetical protein